MRKKANVYTFDNRWDVFYAISKTETKDLDRNNINIFSDVSGYILSDLDLIAIRENIVNQNKVKLKDIDNLLKNNIKFVFEILLHKNRLKNILAGYLLMKHEFPKVFNFSDINKKIDRIHRNILKEYMIISGNNLIPYGELEYEIRSITTLFEILIDNIELIIPNTSCRTSLSPKEANLCRRYVAKYGNIYLEKFAKVVTYCTDEQMAYIEEVFNI